MKPATAILSAMAALLLHGGLALIAVNLLSPKDKAREPPKPIEVALLSEEPPAQAPPAAPAPTAPSPPPAPPAPLPAPPPVPAPAVERKRPPLKPPARPRIDRKPPRPQPEAPAARPEERPSQSSAGNAPPAAASVAEPPSAAPPAPPSVPRTPVSISASYAATNRKPEYPRLSRQLEEQGTVVLRVLVRADGSAGAVEIRSSSGFALLDQSARSAVQTWRFNPATQDGKPVDEWFLIPIPFKLQN